MPVSSLSTVPGLEELTARFARSDGATFRAGADGVPEICIQAARADAVISLHGAQVLEYRPRGAEPVFWVSPSRSSDVATPIRGGVPICSPWFGLHPDHGQPAHGLARQQVWDLVALEALADGRYRAALCLEIDGTGAHLWPHRAELSCEITVGPRLEILLTVRNVGDSTFILTQALHSYFRVAHAEKVRVEGLGSLTYIDQLDPGSRKKQEGPVEPRGETDRVYLESERDLIIRDPGMGRAIRLASTGSRSTVIWNPGAAAAQTFGDIPAESWSDFLCVETGNCFDDAVRVEPGAKHRVQAIVGVENA